MREKFKVAADGTSVRVIALGSQGRLTVRGAARLAFACRRTWPEFSRELLAEAHKARGEFRVSLTPEGAEAARG